MKDSNTGLEAEKFAHLGCVRCSFEGNLHGTGGSGLSKSSVVVVVDLMDPGRITVAV